MGLKAPSFRAALERVDQPCWPTDSNIHRILLKSAGAE
jgi:hypothetical protein